MGEPLESKNLQTKKAKTKKIKGLLIMNQKKIVTAPPDIEPFREILSQIQDKTDLTVPQGLRIVEEFEKEMLAYPSPQLLDETQHDPVIDDFFRKYKEIQNIARSIMNHITGLETYLDSVNNPKIKLEALQKLKENISFLQADLEFISRLIDRISANKMLERINEQIRIAEIQSETASKTMDIAKRSLFLAKIAIVLTALFSFINLVITILK